MVIQGIRVQIGNGQRALIGKDLWLPDIGNGFITSYLNENIATVWVCRLMVPDHRSWDFDVVNDIFGRRDRSYFANST